MTQPKCARQWPALTIALDFYDKSEALISIFWRTCTQRKGNGKKWGDLDDRSIGSLAGAACHADRCGGTIGSRLTGLDIAPLPPRHLASKLLQADQQAFRISMQYRSARVVLSVTPCACQDIRLQLSWSLGGVVLWRRVSPSDHCNPPSSLWRAGMTGSQANIHIQSSEYHIEFPPPSPGTQAVHVHVRGSGVASVDGARGAL